MNTILPAFANGVLLSVPIAAAVWLALRFSRRSLNAATRYVVWWMALFALMVLPAPFLSIKLLPAKPDLKAAEARVEAQENSTSPISRLTPPIRTPDQQDSLSDGLKFARPTPAAPDLHASTQQAQRQTTQRSAAHSAAEKPSIKLSPPISVRLPSGAWPARMVKLFAALWALVSLLLLARLAASLVILRLRKKSADQAPSRLQRSMERGIAACGVLRQVRIAVVEAGDSPMVAGPFRPCVLIPARLLSALDDAEMEQICVHEAAHLARYDDWSLLLQRTIEALFVFHPVARWISRQIDLEREIACDDFVISGTGQPRPYAACLAHVAELAVGHAGSPLAAAVVDESSHLGRRISTLLDKTRRTGTRILKPQLAAALLAMSLITWWVGKSPALFALSPPQPVPGSAPASIPATRLGPSGRVVAGENSKLSPQLSGSAATAPAAPIPPDAVNARRAPPVDPSDDAWGDPVSGVQLHLAVSKNPPSYLPPQLPGDLSHLEMQIRNMGTDTVTFSCHVGQTSGIEIDGVWYEPGGFFETGTCRAPPALVPGNRSMPIFFAPEFWPVNGKSLAFDGFHVGAGKHVVRVRTSGESFGVEDSAHQVITLVSNAITIETGVPAAQFASNPPQADYLSADSLNIVNDALTNAADHLQKAANQSDYVQKAIAEIDQALDDTKQAAAHIHDDSGAAVPITSPNFDAPPPPAPRTNFMLYSTLNSLKSAYDALTRISGGDFGGYRTRMNDDIAAAAEVLVNGIASYNAKHPQSVLVQPTSDADAWGNSVDGVQLRLGESKNSPPQLPGELPRLEMEIRNGGSEAITYSCDVLGEQSDIEIDGVWYLPGPSAGNGACQPPLAPGAQSDIIYLLPQSLWVHGKIVPFKELNLKPGAHSVRVKTPSGRWCYTETPGDFGNSARITLVSNPITIEVPKAPPAVGRQVPQDRTPSNDAVRDVAVTGSFDVRTAPDLGAKLAFSMDADHLYAIGNNRAILYIPRALLIEQPAAGDFGTMIQGHLVNFDPNADVFSVTSDGRTAILAVGGPGETRPFRLYLVDTYSGQRQNIPSSWYDPDAPYDNYPMPTLSGDGHLISIYSESGPVDSPMTVTVYDWPTKTLVAKRTSRRFSAGGIDGGDITVDGAVEFVNNRVGRKVIDLKTGRLIGESFSFDSVRSLDGAWVVEFPDLSFSELAPKDIVLKNGATGRAVGKLNAQVSDDEAYGQMTGAFCGRTGRFVAASGRDVAMYAIPSGKLLARFPAATWKDSAAGDTDRVSVACSPTGTRVAILSRERLTLHNLR